MLSSKLSMVFYDFFVPTYYIALLTMVLMSIFLLWPAPIPLSPWVSRPPSSCFPSPPRTVSPPPPHSKIIIFAFFYSYHSKPFNLTVYESILLGPWLLTYTAFSFACVPTGYAALFVFLILCICYICVFFQYSISFI
jgi:hypothetical protein